MKSMFSNIIWIVILASFPFFMVSAQHRTADEEFTMALTGDSIITRKLSVYNEPEYLKMIKIIRDADVSFTNLEMLFHDYEPYPMATSGGTWMRGEPHLANELVWAGFDLVSRANNHTGDYGALGMQLTSKYVSKAGLVEAGVGNSLAEAREAKYFETAQARVSLISIASTFAKHMGAGRSRGNVPGRPGLNPLRYEKEYILPEDIFNTTVDTARKLGELHDHDGHPKGYSKDEPGKLHAFDKNFVKGKDFGVITRSNPEDVKEISAVVSNASRLSDFTIVTIHAHEGSDRRTPADFLPVFARNMIDAGADVFVGHGPHALRGIEIYKGKPIFYSLGDFIFQNETLLRLPSDSYEALDLRDNAHLADWNEARYDDDTKGFPVNREIWESVIAVPKFYKGKLSEIKLIPIDLGFGEPRQVRGRPLLADKILAKKIISDLQKRSEPYGTKIKYKNGIGFVDIENSKTE